MAFCSRVYKNSSSFHIVIRRYLHILYNPWIAEIFIMIYLFEICKNCGKFNNINIFLRSASDNILLLFDALLSESYCVKNVTLKPLWYCISLSLQNNIRCLAVKLTFKNIFEWYTFIVVETRFYDILLIGLNV